MKTRILNSKGEPIVLSDQQVRIAKVNQRLVNALGYQIDITTLTAIISKITEQKFFKIPFADYMPVKVGEGSWSAALTTFRTFLTGGQFEEGIINSGSNNGRLAAADAGVDALTIKVLNWGKTVGWTLPELQIASRSGNWDIVTSKEKSRKTNWDLGLQRVSFLGVRGDTNALGLLTQSITPNTAVITKAIKSMSTAELKTFQAAIIAAYRLNCAYTAWPTHFIIPESDYLGLAAQAAPDFPIKSVLVLLEDAFKAITQNPNFKILPLAYADVVNSDSQLTTQRYTLLNYDEESVRMDIPVDYTATLANSNDNFSFQNVGFGQFTGVLAYRPLEMMYFDYTP